MGINELSDGIAEVINRFAGELAKQRLQEEISRTGLPGRSSAETKSGQGPEVKPENSERKSSEEAGLVRIPREFGNSES